jgi:nitrate/nitrite-specific signal transduction histidine kinase
MRVHVSSEQNETPLRTGAADGEERAFADVAQLLHQARSKLELAGRDNARMRAELTARIETMKKSAEEMEKLLVQTERQVAQLANLYVATYQLHASLDIEDVHTAIADIAVNLLGAEQFRLFIRTTEGKMALARGSSVKRLEGKTVEYLGGDQLVDACLGERALRFGPVPGSKTLVVVPLSSHGEIVGALAIDALFPHRPSLDNDDRELLDLLGAHAASALLAARAFQQARSKVDTFEGLLGLLRKGAGR